MSKKVRDDAQLRVSESKDYAMKRRTEKENDTPESAKAVGNVARRRKIAKAICDTGIASKYKAILSVNHTA
jgi:hypothetical protein